MAGEKDLSELTGYNQEALIEKGETPIELGAPNNDANTTKFQGYQPSTNISEEKMQDLLNGGSKLLSDPKLQDPNYIKELQSKHDKLFGKNNIENQQNVNAANNDEGWDPVKSMNDKMGKKAETSGMLDDPEVKARTVADWKGAFKNFAQEYAEAEEAFKEYGVLDGFLDENGDPIATNINDGLFESGNDTIKKEVKTDIYDDEDEQQPKEDNKGIISLSKRGKGVLGKDSLSKLEKLKNRRRKGYFYTGFLPNSNLMIRAYPMNTGLKKYDLFESIMHLSTTSIYNERMMKMLYEHTSILTSDGKELTFEQFCECIHMDDIDDLFMCHLIAGTKGEPLPGFTSTCDGIPEEGSEIKECPKDKKEEWKYDLDIKAVYENSCRKSESFMKKFKAYNQMNTLLENLKVSKIDEIYTLEYIDSDKGDVWRLELTRPSLSKYFNRLDKVKQALIAFITTNELGVNFINSISDWNILPLDEQIARFAGSEIEDIKKLYGEYLVKVQMFVFMDKIEIIPQELLEAGMSAEEIVKDENYICISMDNDNVEEWVELEYDLDNSLSDKISEIISDFGKSDNREYLYRLKCPKCGVMTRKKIFRAQQVFSHWIGKDFL